MNTALQAKYDESFNEAEKCSYRAFLGSVSSVSVFDDNKWVCDKRRRSASEQNTKLCIYFGTIPEMYCEMVKYYTLRCFINGNVIATVRHNVQTAGIYLRFLNECRFDKADFVTASEYRKYLDETDLAESTKERSWSSISKLYSSMNGWNGVRLCNPFSVNPYHAEKLYDYKYIPEGTAKQLDEAFISKKIPLHLRCIYWLLRLIPSRISEILGMKIDCVKPFDGHFCISIPTWKQNGGYMQPLMRVMHINNADTGAYLLELIAEQQKKAYICQEYLPDDKRGCLFSVRCQIELGDTVYDKDSYMPVTWSTVSYGLQKVCREYGITGEDGQPYRVTSHQFRHNGITDRLVAGYTPAEIADMTGHHGSAMMLASYAHFNLFPENIPEPIECRSKAVNTAERRVTFSGKIIDMDSVNEVRLMKSLRSHRIPGGICADVTHCKSGMWNCIDCELFVPESEQIMYFTEQAEEWERKAGLFRNDTTLAAKFRDNAQNFRNIITKLKDMEKSKDE